MISKTISVIVFLMMISAAIPSRGAIRAMTPDMYGGNTNAWQVKVHRETFMPAVTNGGADVVFIGDSITDFWRRAGKDVFEKHFGDGSVKVMNLGVSADRTEHVLWRITEGGELDGYKAKIVFLMIGTNNAGHRSIKDEPPVDTILGIREILRVIREKQPTAKIVLTAIFPCGRDENDAIRRRNSIVNKEIAKFADGKDILWLDFNEQFLTPDGVLPRELFPDLLHPSALGYEIWYSAIKPYIDAALSDGKLPMPPNRYASCRRWASDYIEGVPATYPTMRIRSEGYGEFDWWLDRLMRNRKEISECGGEIDLVFFGDSITHNWESKGKDALDELRKTYSILDIGYSGDRTEHLLWRGEYGELDGYKAKCIMLMIGTNNTWHRKDKPQVIADGIRKILELIARKQPDAKVMLLPIFPFGDGPEHPNRINNEKVNAIIKDYADGKKVIWVDFNAKFLDEKGDTIKWMDDRCHPNAAGYREIWMPSVLPYFRDIIGK